AAESGQMVRCDALAGCVPLSLAPPLGEAADASDCARPTPRVSACALSVTDRATHRTVVLKRAVYRNLVLPPFGYVNDAGVVSERGVQIHIIAARVQPQPLARHPPGRVVPVHVP